MGVPILLMLRISCRLLRAGKFIFCPKDEDCQGRLGLKAALATVQLIKSGKMVRSVAGQNEEGQEQMSAGCSGFI